MVNKSKRGAKREGMENVSIGLLARRMAKGEYRVPYFQRDYVWSETRIKSWAELLKGRQKYSGCITIYYVEDENDNSAYIADGLQRITTTKRIFDNWSHYGFDSLEEVTEAADNITYPVIYHILADHGEAHLLFRQVNVGQQMTRGDYFKGALTQTEVGQYIYENIPQIVFTQQARICTSVNRSAHKRTADMYGELCKFKRSSLSLLLQYVLRYKHANFWNVGASSLPEDYTDPGTNEVEMLLHKWILSKSSIEVEKQIDQFSEAVKRHTALIIQNWHFVCSQKQESRHYAISQSFYHWLLHLCFYANNFGYTQDWLSNMMITAMSLSRNGTTELYYIDSVAVNNSADKQIGLTDQTKKITLRISSLAGAEIIERVYGIDSIRNKANYIRRGTTDGFQNAHITRYASATTPQAASLNAANGAGDLTVENYHGQLQSGVAQLLYRADNK
jgi:hypothetical protein